MFPTKINKTELAGFIADKTGRSFEDVYSELNGGRVGSPDLYLRDALDLGVSRGLVANFLSSSMNVPYMSALDKINNDK